MTAQVILCSHSPSMHQIWYTAMQECFSVERVSNLKALREKLKRYREVILILDLLLPELHARQHIEDIHSSFPATRTLAVCDREDNKEIAALFCAGIKGYCHKNLTPQLLRKAVQKVRDGETWLERRHVCTILSEIAQRNVGTSEQPSNHPLLATLTKREREITALVSEGLCQKEIARRLVISEHTARNHLRNIFNKTGVSSRLQLAVMLNGGMAQ